MEKGREALEQLGFSSTSPCGGKGRVFHVFVETKVFHITHRVFHGEKSENVENLQPYFLVLMLVVMAFTVSAKAASFFMRCSTCSMECMTVVWSRPPNSLPMSA